MRYQKKEKLLKEIFEGVLWINTKDKSVDIIKVPIKVKEGRNTTPILITPYPIRDFKNYIEVKRSVEDSIRFFKKKYSEDNSLCYLNILIKNKLNPINMGPLNLIDLTKL